MRHFLFLLLLLPLGVCAQQPVTNHNISVDTIGKVYCRFFSSTDNRTQNKYHYVQVSWKKGREFAVVQITGQEILDSLIKDLENGLQLLKTSQESTTVRNEYSIKHSSGSPNTISICAPYYMGCTDLEKEGLEQLIVWLKTIKFP